MQARLSRLREEISESYWFVPAAMALGALLLAIATAQLDRMVDHAPEDRLGWFYGGDADSARDILGTIATAIMTVVSLTFSVTVVTLTLAGNQFGSRILHNFMRDRSNQFVLGTFISTFIYSLLTLRMIEGDGQAEWVPHISVTLALVLAIVSVGALIYFIHHVIEEVQADNVVASVSKELENIISRRYPHRRKPLTAQERGLNEMILDRVGQPAQRLAATHEGVLQAIDIDRLVGWASRHALLLRVRYRPGEFVTRGVVAFEVYPAERVPEGAAAECSAALLTGARRTQVQDVEFGFDQLAEIAVRALSSSLNDPFTAMNCIDRLGAALMRVMERDAPPAVYYDADGEPRVLLEISGFSILASRAFDLIRAHGEREPQVMLHLLGVLGLLLENAATDEQRAVLWEQAELARDKALEAAGEHAKARDEVEDQFGRLEAGRR